MKRLVLLLLHVIVTISIQDCAEGDCPNTRDHCIHIETEPMTWRDAESFCLKRDGHLTSVHNKIDNNIIQIVSDSTNCEYYWMGGLCNDSKCTWTDGLPFDFTFWDMGQPDSNNCISAYSGTGEWHTIDCSAKECFVCEMPQAMTDCDDWYNAGYTDSGEYRILLNGLSYNVYCDMSDEGGWTVIQRRVDGNESFWNRKWYDYKSGFNVNKININSNFWMGLELLHLLSVKDADVALRVEMNGDRTPGSKNPNGYWFIEYTNFQVASEALNYTLKNMYLDWKNPVGNASTGCNFMYDMTYSIGAQFSTVDRINDPEWDCVTTYKLGGWWLRNCALSSLNGDYTITNANNGYGMFWIVNGFDDIIHPRETVMMVKPKAK